MRPVVACVALWAGIATAAGGAAKSKELPKLIVLDFTAAGVPPEVASALTETAAVEIAARGFFQVVTSRDLLTLVGVERERQLLGCSEGSCLAELGGALDARVVLSGSVSRLGDNMQLTMQALDAQKSQPLGRAVRIAKDVGPLRSAIPFAVAEVTGIPPPEPPSRALQYSLMTGGGVAIVAGAAVGVVAFAQEEALLRELQLGERQRGVLGTAEDYRTQANQISILKLSGLGAVVAGVGLIGLGWWASPPAVAEGTHASLVTDGRSAALVFSGVW